MLQPPFPAIVPTLRDDTLHLRALTEADIPSWFARATDVQSAILAGDTIPASIADGAPWLARHHARFRAQTAIRWAIVPANAPASVGSIALTFPSPGARTAQLGYVVARAWWGQGLGTAAARQVTRYAFETLGLAELHSETLQRNTASRRILEKLGFRQHRAMPAHPPAEPEPFDYYRLPAPRP